MMDLKDYHLSLQWELDLQFDDYMDDPDDEDDKQMMGRRGRRSIQRLTPVNLTIAIIQLS